MKKFEQDYKYLYNQKVEEVKVLERALELACEEVAGYQDDDYYKNGYGIIRTNNFDYFIQQAKKED